MLQNSERLAASKKPSFAQVGEVCASGITFINANYNGVLVHGSGRIIMILGVILMSAFVFLRNLRQLEIAGDFGFIVVLIMVIVIMVSNIAHNVQQDRPSNYLEGYLRTTVKSQQTLRNHMRHFGEQHISIVTLKYLLHH